MRGFFLCSFPIELIFFVTSTEKKSGKATAFSYILIMCGAGVGKGIWSGRTDVGVL